MAVVCLNILFNLLVIIYYCFNYVRLHKIRRDRLMKYRETRRHKTHATGVALKKYAQLQMLLG